MAGGCYYGESVSSSNLEQDTWVKILTAPQNFSYTVCLSPEDLPAAFWEPRRCMREPIQEIFDVAALLDRAVDAHLRQDKKTAVQLLIETDLPAVREWTESLWGGKQKNPDQWRYHRWRPIPGLDAPKQKVKDRMPRKKDLQIITDRDGYNCRFCGIPVLPRAVRDALSDAYPEAKLWGSKNNEQHAALQCLWLQFDHIVPHCWGGENTPDNVVITCAPCNYGRGNWAIGRSGFDRPARTPCL